jgi:serine/threonine protein kinase
VKKIFISLEFSDKLFLDEINCLVNMKHDNVVRFLGYCSDSFGELVALDRRHVMAEKQQRLLCFEYVSNGNLQSYLKGKDNNFLFCCF